MEPNRNFNNFDEKDEPILDYCRRVKNVVDVPEEVAEQWLYCHYYNGHTVDNYGWLDYREAKFDKVAITTDDAIALRVINSYSDYVASREEAVPFSEFMCTPRDKQHWIEERTWRTPPIVIDVKSFGKPPAYADISEDWQLVEGHSRLGYLLAMHRAGKSLKECHFVYMLTQRKNV